MLSRRIIHCGLSEFGVCRIESSQFKESKGNEVPVSENVGAGAPVRGRGRNGTSVTGIGGKQGPSEWKASSRTCVLVSGGFRISIRY